MEITTFKRISEISEGFALWYLTVFVVRVWEWESAETGPKISMILSDDEGIRIEATISTENFKKFGFVRWMEKRWFTLRDPDVEKNSTYAPLAPHKYRLRFNYGTGFHPIFDKSSDKNLIVYRSIDDIYSDRIDDRFPIDIIGVITWIGKIDRMWSGPRIQFTIRDSRLTGLECLAHGNLAIELFKQYRNVNDAHLFVILRCFSVVKHSGGTWLKSVGGYSEIEYNMFGVEDFYDFYVSYSDPIPEAYSNDHKNNLWVF